MPSTQTADQTRLTISVIGAGRAGSTLALAAHNAGYTINAIYTRTPNRAKMLQDVTGAQFLPDIASLARSADLILIAVPDDAIVEVDRMGAGAWQEDSGVVHVSGLHSATILQHAKAAGASTGTLHPLQAITNPEIAQKTLSGTYFGISGSPQLLPVLQAFVTALHGIPLVIPDEGKALYHAAAVFASNYIVTCFAQAVDIMISLGISQEQASQALIPLTQGAVANLSSPGLPHALTGPISRGDLGTIEMHKKNLSSLHHDTLALYCQLGNAAIATAAAQGQLSSSTLAALVDTFSDCA